MISIVILIIVCNKRLVNLEYITYVYQNFVVLFNYLLYAEYDLVVVIQHTITRVLVCY